MNGCACRILTSPAFDPKVHLWRLAIFSSALWIVFPLGQSQGGSREFGAVPSPCQIVWQYFRHTSEWDTGAIHLGIRNVSDRGVVINTLKVDGKMQPWPEDLPDPQQEIEASRTNNARWYFPRNVHVGDVMWFRFSRDAVPPGGLTELIIRFQTPPEKAVEIELDTASGACIRTTVETRVLPILITAVTFSADLSKMYVYVHNAGQHEQFLQAIELNGQDRTAGSVIVNRSLSPGTSGCIAIPAPQHLQQGDYVYVRVKTRDGAVTGNGIRAFSCFVIPGRPVDVVLRQFTDDPYGQLDLVARQILQRRPVLQGEEMIQYWSNQGFIKYGIMAFGELVDCATLHCQPTEVEYLGKYRPHDPHYVQAKVRYIREALAPRPLFAQTEVHHALMGSNLQGLLSPIEMRLRVYYMISRGAKGIFYRGKLEDESTPFQREMLQAEMDRIADELAILQPLLRIGESADGLATCSEPLVEPSVVLCGNEAMVVILFNHDRQMSWPKNEMYLGDSFWIEPKPDRFRVDLRIPAEITVANVFEIGGKWSHPQFDMRNHICSVTVDGIVDTRIVAVGFGGTVAGNLLTQRIRTAPRNSVSRHPPGKTDGIDSMIDALVSTVTFSAERSPWDPVTLAELTADDKGPDIQFEEKQYYFGQVPPGEWHWHSFNYRNVGRMPLEIALCETPSSIKAEVGKAVLSPGDRGHIRIGFWSSIGRTHSVIQLKTNDSNEKTVRLEIGSDPGLQMRSVPDNVHLSVDPLQSNIVNKTIRLIYCGKGDLDIHNIEPSSECIHCDFMPARNATIVTRSHADIFEGEYTQRECEVAVCVNASGMRGTTREYIAVTADGAGSLEIPVTIQVVDPVICSPRHFFFGTVSCDASETVRILSKGVPFKVEKIDYNDPRVKVDLSEIQAQEVYELTATIGPAKPNEVVRGEIRIMICCRDQEYAIPVRFFALIQ